MNIVTINVQEPYHSYILNGKKTVEGRLNKGKFATINIGDIIEIEPEKIQFDVVEKNIYSNFKSMIEKEGVNTVIPDKQTLEEAVNVYYKFYTKEQEKEFGVVAIKIRKK
jgi:ASC-1-like (ASCH) protein